MNQVITVRPSDGLGSPFTEVSSGWDVSLELLELMRSGEPACPRTQRKTEARKWRAIDS